MPQLSRRHDPEAGRVEASDRTDPKQREVRAPAPCIGHRGRANRRERTRSDELCILSLGSKRALDVGAMGDRRTLSRLSSGARPAPRGARHRLRDVSRDAGTGVPSHDSRDRIIRRAAVTRSAGLRGQAARRTSRGSGSRLAQLRDVPCARLLRAMPCRRAGTARHPGPGARSPLARNHRAPRGAAITRVAELRGDARCHGAPRAAGLQHLSHARELSDLSCDASPRGGCAAGGGPRAGRWRCDSSQAAGNAWPELRERAPERRELGPANLRGLSRSERLSRMSSP